MERLTQFESVKNLSKAELVTLGKTEADKLIDSGLYNASDLAVSARKAVEYLGSFISSLNTQVLDELYSNGSREILSVLGSELSVGSTGDRYDFERDVIYKNLAIQLKARAELLKDASKSDVEIVDSDGVVVAKVPIKTASRDTIKFKL